MCFREDEDELIVSISLMSDLSAVCEPGKSS